MPDYELLGKLKPLMEDEEITEIMVNGPNNVFVERQGRRLAAEINISREEIINIVTTLFKHYQHRLDYYQPFGDVALEDGSRVNAVLSPIACGGPFITVRKLSPRIKTLDDLIALGTLTEKAKVFLIACIKFKLNIIFSGATGVGKTTLLKLLSSYIPPQERLVVIEDVAEIQLKHPNLVSMLTRAPDEEGKGEVTLRDLVRNALRMRPERIILGEIRGEEALDILQAMSTGHRGSFGIIHSNSPREVLSRLETLIKFSGLDISSADAKALISSTVDIIVHIEHFPDGKRRITHISELRGMEKGEIYLQDIYFFKYRGKDAQGNIQGSLLPAFKVYPKFYKEMKKEGLVSEEIFSSEERWI